MDKCGYYFATTVKGWDFFANSLIMNYKGKFEDCRSCAIKEYRTYGMKERCDKIAEELDKRYDEKKTLGARELLDTIARRSKIKAEVLVFLESNS